MVSGNKYNVYAKGSLNLCQNCFVLFEPWEYKGGTHSNNESTASNLCSHGCWFWLGYRRNRFWLHFDPECAPQTDIHNGRLGIQNRRGTYMINKVHVGPR